MVGSLIGFLVATVALLALCGCANAQPAPATPAELRLGGCFAQPSIDYGRLMAAMAADPRFRGPTGPPGPPGPATPATVQINYQQLLELMAEDGRFRGPAGETGGSELDYDRLLDLLRTDPQFTAAAGADHSSPDQLPAGEALPQPASPAGADLDWQSLATTAATAALGGLGVATPWWLGIAVRGGLAIYRRRQARQAGAGQNSRIPGIRESGAPPGGEPAVVIATENPPPRQVVRPLTEFVTVETDRHAKASAWAREQVARKFPGNTEMLAVLQSLTEQYLNAQGSK